MNQFCGVQPTGALPGGSYYNDYMLDELSRQMAVSQSSRRMSRGSSGQRSGTSMRVMKPTSASTSPRSATMARRRTLMNGDNTQRRWQQALEQASTPSANDMAQAHPRSSRPLSWHPNSYGQTQMHISEPCHISQNTYTAQQDMYSNQAYMSPMAMAYSCNTSPTALSPLALPFQGADNMQYYGTEDAGMPHLTGSTYARGQTTPDFCGTSADSSSINGWDWNTFAMQGFSATSPPTPEAYPQTQLAHPVVSEECVPYQALDEPEDEGEVLIGMGLYDTPEKVEDDPQLDNYRSTVTSLLGSTFLGGYEPKGKGLKLEETWEPPTKSDDSDDEEEEEDDEDSDEEAE